MKLLRLEDVARKVGKRPAEQAPLLVELRITNLAGFDAIDISPGNSFVTVCGGTGAGKTALLESIYAVLAPAGSVIDVVTDIRLPGAEVSGTIDYADGRYTATRTIWTGSPPDAADEGFPPGVKLVELVERTYRPREYFIGQDVAVLKEGLAPTMLDKASLEAVSIICRRDYVSARIFEVEESGDRLIPFFEIESGGFSYDNRSMATGELSAFAIAWALKSAPPNSIVLIEEPEAFLPPVGHLGMVGLIAHAALKGRLGIVLSTHSEIVASNVPEAGLVSMRKRAGRSMTPSSRESKVRTLSQLGLRPQVSALLFVEDDLAGEIVSYIVSMFDFHVACNIEVVNTKGGVGGVKRALEGLSGDIKTFRFLGVLDGDQRGSLAGWSADSEKKVVYLPFSVSTEAELIACVAGNSRRFARIVGRSKDQVDSLLQDIDGLDSHDQLHRLSSLLGKTVPLTVEHLLRNWLETPKNKSVVKSLANELASRLQISLP